MSDNDICYTARVAYENGRDPIDHAVWIATMHLETMAEILEARKTNPGAYPIVRLPVTLERTVRRILGELIDAGWTPPAVRSTPDDVSAITDTGGPDVPR